MRRIFRVYRDWVFLALYLVTILFILPFSDSFFRNISNLLHWFPVFGETLIKTVLVAGVISIGFYVLAANKKPKLIRLIVLSSLICAGAYLLKNIEGLIDKLHIIEYSALSFLLFRTLRFYNPTTALYLWCMLFILTSSVCDETIQQFLPGRTFDLRDIRNNIFAGVLSLSAIAFVINPRLERWRVRLSILKKKIEEREEWIDQYLKR